MRTLKIPMWEAGAKLLLKEALKSFDLPLLENWTVHDLCGSGRGFRGWTHMELEALTQRENGLLLDYLGLVELAESLSDLQDVLVLGEDEGRLLVSLQAIDSSIWKIDLREPEPPLRETSEPENSGPGLSS